MEPLTAIMGALQVVTTVADNQIVKDAYAGFKALLIRKFGSNNRLQRTLEDYEAKPAVYDAPMKDVIQEVGADRDQDLVNAATELLKQAEAVKPGITGGLVGQINANGGQVNVVGHDVYGGINNYAPTRTQQPTPDN